MGIYGGFRKRWKSVVTGPMQDEEVDVFEYAVICDCFSEFHGQMVSRPFQNSFHEGLIFGLASVLEGSCLAGANMLNVACTGFSTPRPRYYV